MIYIIPNRHIIQFEIEVFLRFKNIRVIFKNILSTYTLQRLIINYYNMLKVIFNHDTCVNLQSNNHIFFIQF